MKILVLRVINSSRHRKCFVLAFGVICVKSPHSLVPRSFGFLTQTTRAYNPVRRTFYDVNYIIIHQTHYEKSDWSRAFNQFTIACELDMINVISAADITFMMSSSTSAWLLSPLECSQKQNGWTLRFCFWGWIMWKMYNKTISEFSFRMISWIIKPSCLCYLPQPSASADNTVLGFDNSWYHAQPHPIIVYWKHRPKPGEPSTCQRSLERWSFRFRSLAPRFSSTA